MPNPPVYTTMQGRQFFDRLDGPVTIFTSQPGARYAWSVQVNPWREVSLSGGVFTVKERLRLDGEEILTRKSAEIEELNAYAT